MDFGIAMPTAADNYKVVQRAEELGFTHAWFYDTQMLSADCFVAMGAAAVHQTVSAPALVPSNRSAVPPTPAAQETSPAASISAGTGFTARRHGRCDQGRDMESYVQQVYGLLRRNRRVRDGGPEENRFPIPDCRCSPGSVSYPFRPRPRARADAKMKAGWIDFVGVENGVKEVTAMREEWKKAGHAMADLEATAFALGCVLADGEPADSGRAMAQAGPRAAVMLHRAADEALAGLKPGVAMLSTPEIDGYVELARGFKPEEARYLENHRGHLMFVKPEEKKFVTAKMIAETSFTAGEAEIKRRIEALRSAGCTQFTIQLMPGQEKAIEDGRIRQAFK
jgi:5,10-methylenetetrahydromethanopterin reductase